MNKNEIILYKSLLYTYRFHIFNKFNIYVIILF